jgi:hypothetical protein
MLLHRLGHEVDWRPLAGTAGSNFRIQIDANTSIDFELRPDGMLNILASGPLLIVPKVSNSFDVAVHSPNSLRTYRTPVAPVETADDECEKGGPCRWEQGRGSRFCINCLRDEPE